MENPPNIKSVIVADDDALIRSILRSKFESIGLTVFVAADGLEAVEFASRVRPALIMLDLNMPRLNGLLACERIRAMPHNRDTPIIVLTSTQHKEAERAAATVGVTAYLKKPFRPAELLEVLTRYMSMDHSTRLGIRRDADRSAAIAQTAPASGPRKTAGDGAHDDPFNLSKSILEVMRGR